MCGVCGIYHYASGTGRPVDEELIRTMTARLAHRGPDGAGFLIDGGLGLGVRRLSIIDLAGGDQPIWNENGTRAIVFNGEIYNYRALRAELEPLGHRFRTATDTESALHAWEQWDLAGLARLNGMFGLALWDARARTLVVARDPFGIKPLYYHTSHGTLRFASEIRALLADPAVPRAVDREALLRYLALTYAPAPRTAFAGIRKLRPGHALVVTPNGVRQERYAPPPGPPLTGRRARDLVEELRDRIRDAVHRQMAADVPVGLLLSGGVDSATVAALMTEAAAVPVETFTAGFEGDFAGNELAEARDLARRLGTRHHEVVLSRAAFDGFLPEAVRALEEPVAITSTLPFLRVCQEARHHVKVVLTGQGADEPFAGYPRYLGERYGGVLRALPAPLRRGLLPMVERLPRNERLKRAARSLGVEQPLTRMARIELVADPRILMRLLPDSGDVVRAIAADFAPPHAAARRAGLDPLAAMLYADARLSLPDNLLLYGDKLSMAASIEARVPFLDLDLMAFVERIPARFKIRGGAGKALLKRAVAVWTPPETLARRKVGFETPVDVWLRGAMGVDLRDRLLAPGAACRTWLDGATVETLLAEHRVGRHDHKRLLFALLMFELWHDAFITPGTALR